MSRAAEELLAEVGQLAAWYHWPLDTLLDLPHADRQFFLELIPE